MILAMEFLSFPLLLCFISFVSLLLYTLVKKNKSKPTNQERPILPPGRTGWPVIGETVDYFSKFQNGVSEKFVVERSNKYSPKVFKTSLIGQPMAFLCGPEGNKFLFSNEKKLVRVWYPMSLRKIFPEVQEKERKMFHTFLKADALRKYVGTMDMLMKQHLETDWNREEVSVNPMVKKYILTLACRLIIGIDDPNKVEELATLIERVEAGIFSVPVNLPGTTLNRAMKAAKEIIKDVLNIIKQRKADLLDKDSASMQDILSLVFLTADENGSFLNESDIAGSILGLLVGGYSGISGTVTIIMKYLAELPHAYDEVLRGKQYKLHTCFNKVIRKHSPPHGHIQATFSVYLSNLIIKD
ncbi:hypothetical protein RJ639_014377 [Escallonia herrerae]|uniref:Cytochrome P450 n=1 Tax=Escallonia herrerae TaxID=1293975 RepID=A0AA89AQY9_9ASTE|nr:hypothetical protein RJ639_014377 [Escallonia herrerae]